MNQLQRLYDSEHHFGLEVFWDEGFQWWIGPKECPTAQGWASTGEEAMTAMEFAAGLPPAPVENGDTVARVMEENRLLKQQLEAALLQAEMLARTDANLEFIRRDGGC